MLLQSTGYRHRQNIGANNQKLTIIYNNYLKYLREELLEEAATNVISHNHEIIYITTEIEGVPTQIIIDTGANLSLINITDLEKMQKQRKRILPILPVNYIILIGATGRQNKTVRNQVSLGLTSKGVVINIVL